MVTTIVSIIIGIIGGYLIHAVAIKVNFKQRAIEDKKNLYASMIGQWLEMRNFIYDNSPNPHKNPQFDRFFAESMGIASKIRLVSSDSTLFNRIENLSSRTYYTHWSNLTPDKKDDFITTLFDEAQQIITIMKQDILDTSRIELEDLLHIFKGLVRRKNN